MLVRHDQPDNDSCNTDTNECNYHCRHVVYFPEINVSQSYRCHNTENHPQTDCRYCRLWRDDLAGWLNKQ